MEINLSPNINYISKFELIVNVSSSISQILISTSGKVIRT